METNDNLPMEFILMTTLLGKKVAIPIFSTHSPPQYISSPSVFYACDGHWGAVVKEIMMKEY